MVLLLDGTPHMIEEFHATGSAQTKHKLHTRMRNLRTGRTLERSFADTEHAAVADVQHRTVQFSYRQGDRFVFLDSESFEEVALTAGQIGERHWFISENREYKAMFVEGKLLDIVLPEQIGLAVVETAPPQRGAQSTAYKEAVVEGGLTIMVPLFIGPSDIIRVDTRDRKYAGKESSG
jgi:elongation factor P